MSIPTHSFGHLHQDPNRHSRAINFSNHQNHNDDENVDSPRNQQTRQNRKNKDNNNNNNNNRGRHQREGVLLKTCGSHLAEENDEGSVEYKWRLVGITEQRLNHLITQMKFRVAEGRGECIYEIGVEDDGYTRGLPQAEFDESIATLRTMAARLGFTLDMNCVVSKPNPKDPSQMLKCAEVRVTKIVQTLPTCRVAVIGDTNSGKSTLVGVVAAGELDDGSGTVRQRVFNHKHELQSGQTSSVCDRVVGFSSEGGIVNYQSNGGCTDESTAKNNNNNKCNNNNNNNDYSLEKNITNSSNTNISNGNAHSGDTDTIAERAATLTLLMDLPGHLKRSHTTLSALVGRFPHVVCLVINPNYLTSAAPSNSASNISSPIFPNPSSSSATASGAGGAGGGGAGGDTLLAGNGSRSSSSSTTATAMAKTTISTHIAQCAALQLPFFVVFTHQDSTPPLVLGQAAAQVDRAIGEETGKRLVMVSAPIYPGESGGGFSGREMIHASSDMFLSDLASTVDHQQQQQQQQQGNNKTPGKKSNKAKDGKPKEQLRNKNNNNTNKSREKSYDPFYSFGDDEEENRSTASPLLKSDLGTSEASTSPNNAKRSRKDNKSSSSTKNKKNRNNNNNNNNNSNDNNSNNNQFLSNISNDVGAGDPDEDDDDEDDIGNENDNNEVIDHDSCDDDDGQHSSASGGRARHDEEGSSQFHQRHSRNPVEMYLEKNVPVFIVSSVSGYGIQFFKHFLHQLSLTPPRLTVDECEDEPVMGVVANDDDDEEECENDGKENDESDTSSSSYFDRPSQMLRNNDISGESKSAAPAPAASSASSSSVNAATGGTSSSSPWQTGSASDIIIDHRHHQQQQQGQGQGQTTKMSSKSKSKKTKTLRPVPTVRFVVDKVYSVARVGLVAAGTVTSGTIQVGQHLFWGPSKQGSFFPVQIASLHYQRNFVRSVGGGNECAVAFEGGDFSDAPDVLAMSARRGTLLYGNGRKEALPPATSRDFRVLLSKAHAVTTAQSDFNVDVELTAFVFSAKQTVFLKSIEPVDFSSEEYAMVRPQRSVGDALRPLILQCSFVFHPEVLAVGAPIVLLRNTPDGRLGACVAGRILSYVACDKTKLQQQQNATDEQNCVSATSTHQTLHHHSRRKTKHEGSSGAATTTTASAENSNSTSCHPSANSLAGFDEEEQQQDENHHRQRQATRTTDDTTDDTGSLTPRTRSTETAATSRSRSKTPPSSPFGGSQNNYYTNVVANVILQRDDQRRQQQSLHKLGDSVELADAACARGGETDEDAAQEQQPLTQPQRQQQQQQQQQQGQFPKDAAITLTEGGVCSTISAMKKPQTSSPPLTPTTSPPMRATAAAGVGGTTTASSTTSRASETSMAQNQNLQQQQAVIDAADLEIAKERNERKKLRRQDQRQQQKF